MRFALLAAFPILLAACGQDIVTVECADGGHPDPTDSGVITVADGGITNPDATANDPDATANDPDATTNRDATVDPDGGMMTGCGASPYCITALPPSVASANVREAVTFTPVIDNPNSIALTFTAPEAEIVATRKPGLPALVKTEIDLNYTVAPNGAITFSVAEVPPHFTTTTFTVKLHAKGPGSMPEVIAEGQVEVRGNVLIASGNAVYAVASDGRPARSISLMSGRIIEGSSFIRDPGNMILARDGTLIVYDKGTAPERVRRFELSGENVHLGDFEYQNGSAEPYIMDGQTATGLAQLMDGRIALVIYDYDRTPADSGIIIWNADGTYERTINALDPNVEWQGLTASKTANELLVIEQGGNNRLIRIDPTSNAELGVVATDIVSAWGLLAMPSGHTYVGVTAGIIRVTPQGGKTMISMLMTASIDYWNFLTPFSGGRVLATRDVSSDFNNIAVVDGTVATGLLRPMNVGGSNLTPDGLVYLELE
jgi:hypothetical protein